MTLSAREQASLFEALVERSTDAVLVSRATPGSRSLVVDAVNPAFLEMTGFRREEVVGEAPGMMLGPETDAAAIERIEAAVRAGERIAIDLVLQRADGSPLRVHATYDRVGGDDGDALVLVSYRDREVALAEVEQRERWAERLVQGGSDLVLVMDHQATVTYASPAVEKILGYTPAEFVGQPQMKLIHPDDRAGAAKAFEGASPDPVELRVLTRERDWKILDVLVTNMLDDPVVAGIVINVRDVTSRRRAEVLLAEQADLLEAIARGAPLEITLQKITQMIEHSVEGARCAIGMLDTDGVIRVRAAPSLPRQIVNLLDELSPKSVRGVELRDTTSEFIEYDLIDDERFASYPVFADQGLVRCRVSSLRAPGSGDLLGGISVFSTSEEGLTLFDRELFGRARNLAAIAIERRRFESTLEYQALYDNLTGLPNRALLHTRIGDALTRAERVHTGVAVLFIDLDRFKVINDSVGHALGDQLLQQVAERLREPLRPGDTLGRFGGDKYMVVCNRVEDEAAAVESAERFGAVLSEPFRLGGGEIFVTATIGISFASDSSVSPEQMIRNADVAMYRAKDQGRNGFAVFEADRDQRKVEQLALEQALRFAIEAGEFELHFQPAVRLSDGAMNHVEALVRWHRPGHGMVMPGLFIPLAEETGLIVPLGWWVLEKACEIVAGWPELPGGEQMQVAVNLSARQLAAPELHSVVEGVLARSGLGPERLCFEVTESDLVHDVEHAVAALVDLKLLGVAIAIDDFGTGYASLEYIRHFTMADYLKIDRSFVDGMEKPGSQEAAIVTAAIAMAKSLGLKTVAEGVETEGQADALRALNCELAQGYFFSRPIPAADCIALTTTPAP